MWESDAKSDGPEITISPTTAHAQGMVG